MDPQRSEVQAPPHVLEYLGGQNTMTLATASPSGLPHAATHVYASDGLTLYFWTRPETRTARHLAQNPFVSFTIDSYSADWSSTRGIQGAGEVRQVLSADEVRQVVDLFRAKFPALAGDQGGQSFFGELSFFRINPSEVEYIDRAEGAGSGQQALGMEYQRSLIYSVFRSLPRQEIDTIAGQLRTTQVGAGEVVVRQGAPADKFFIIVDGELEVLREEGGAQTCVATLSRGQFFGEIAILRDMPRTATVRASTPATLLAMDRDTFRSLIAQSLATTRDFDQVIQDRLSSIGSS